MIDRAVTHCHSYLDFGQISRFVLQCAERINTVDCVNLDCTHVSCRAYKLCRVAHVFRFYLTSGGCCSTPTMCWTFASVSRLALNKNGLTGAIPVGISTMRALRCACRRKRGTARFAVCGFICWFSLPCCRVRLCCSQIELQANQLTGSITTGFSTLTSLQYMDLSSNALSGSIPTQLLLLSRLLQYAS